MWWYRPTATYSSQRRCVLLSSLQDVVISGCLEIGSNGEGGKSRRNTEGSQETFGGDGYVYYLDCGNGFTGIYTYMCQNSKSQCSLKICAIYCMSIVLQKVYNILHCFIDGVSFLKYCEMILSHPSGWLPSKEQKITAGRDVGKLEPLCTVGGNGK